MDAIASNFLRFDIMVKYWPMVAQGLGVTLQLALATIATGLIFGLFLSLVRLAGIRVVNIFLMIFVDLFRALPPLVVIIVFYFGLQPLGVQLSGFVAVWLALSMTLSAYAEEVYYSSMLAIDRGQVEAAVSTGLTYPQAIAHVVLPQALKRSIAPLTNRTIATTKSTALASVVAVPEILQMATNVQAIVYNTTPLTMATIAYLMIFFPLVVASRFIEKRYGWKN